MEVPDLVICLLISLPSGVLGKEADNRIILTPKSRVLFSSNLENSLLFMVRQALLTLGTLGILVTLICALRYALVDGRKGNNKFRSHIDLALHLYPSSMLLHNIFCNG